MAVLKLTCVDENGDTEFVDVELSDDEKPISVHELIALIEDGNITADVVGDEEHCHLAAFLQVLKLQQARA